MISIRSITKEEKNLLLSHYKRPICTLTRDRAHALLLSDNNHTAIEISNIIFRCDKSVRQWISDFNKKGISSLFHNYTNNENGAKLTREQKDQIKSTLARSSSEHGIPATFWTLPAFKDHVSATFGVVYESDQSYYYLLKYCNFSWKLPSPFDIRRDDDLIERRMKEIRIETEKYLQNADYEVFFQDETKVNWEEEVRRAWLKSGEKTIVKLSRDKTSQSYFGALNAKSHKCHLIEMGWQDTANIITSLRKLKKEYPHKKLCILWDNARWHKSKGLRELLHKGKEFENVHLINFPPYAPDENPQEKVWKYVKEKVANHHYENFDGLKNEFAKIILKKRFKYSI